MSNAIISIQNELKAPKGQFNSFGRYKYRSCEDILEAVKPLLHKYSCSLNISDEIVMVGDRFYVKATATLRKDTGEVVSSSAAYAREDESKKGMDGAQVTGAASSYARKYALNGLFCIDDTKDADTDEYTKNTKPEKEPAEKDKDWTDGITKKEKLPKVKTKTSDPFELAMVVNGLTMDQVQAFSEAKGNFPGLTPLEYPQKYKDVLMQIDNIEKIKKFVKENENG